MIELHERSDHVLPPAELERWLREHHLAEPNGAPGRLQLTELGVELTEAALWYLAP